MYYWGNDFFGSWGWGCGIIEILISVIIVCIIVRIILRIVHGDSYRYRYHHHWEDWDADEDAKSSARKILDERYAKGEISDEEYKAKKANMK